MVQFFRNFLPFLGKNFVKFSQICPKTLHFPEFQTLTVHFQKLEKQSLKVRIYLIFVLRIMCGAIMICLEITKFPVTFGESRAWPTKVLLIFGLRSVPLQLTVLHNFKGYSKHGKIDWNIYLINKRRKYDHKKLNIKYWMVNIKWCNFKKFPTKVSP